MAIRYYLICGIPPIPFQSFVDQHEKTFFTVPFPFLLTLGPPLPKALRYFSMLEIQQDVFIFGGQDSVSNSHNSAIYQLTCSSVICSWSTIKQELKVGRSLTSAILVPDYFGNFCTAACADIWSDSKCKEKKKAGECNTSCTTDDCVKTQAKCKKKCKIC